MHKSVIKAAFGAQTDGYGDRFAESRGRRVLRAQAQPEAISDDVAAQMQQTIMQASDVVIDIKALRAALSAALLHMSGGEP